MGLIDVARAEHQRLHAELAEIGRLRPEGDRLGAVSGQCLSGPDDRRRRRGLDGGYAAEQADDLQLQAASAQQCVQAAAQVVAQNVEFHAR